MLEHDIIFLFSSSRKKNKDQSLRDWIRLSLRFPWCRISAALATAVILTASFRIHQRRITKSRIPSRDSIEGERRIRVNWSSFIIELINLTKTVSLIIWKSRLNRRKSVHVMSMQLSILPCDCAGPHVFPWNDSESTYVQAIPEQRRKWNEKGRSNSGLWPTSFTLGWEGIRWSSCFFLLFFGSSSSGERFSRSIIFFRWRDPRRTGLFRPSRLEIISMIGSDLFYESLNFTFLLCSLLSKLGRDVDGSRLPIEYL